MKYLFIILAILMVSCKKEIPDQKPRQKRLIRVAAVDNDDSRTYTFIQQIVTGIVVVEFSVEKPVNVREYAIEVSDSGRMFKAIKTLKPGKPDYKDTIYLE